MVAVNPVMVSRSPYASLATTAKLMKRYALILALSALLVAPVARAQPGVVLGINDPRFTYQWSANWPMLFQVEPVQIETGMQGLNTIPPWQNILMIAQEKVDGVDPTWPGGRAIVAADTAALVKAHPNVREVQVWNEPNYPYDQAWGGWVGTADQYVALVAAVHDAVKAVNPSVLVLAGGYHPDSMLPPYRNGLSLSLGDFTAAMKRLYASGGRTTPIMDGFSYHPYWNWKPAITNAVAKWMNVNWRGLPQPAPNHGFKLWWTESGAWSSGAQWGTPPMVLGLDGQAARVRDVLSECVNNKYIGGCFNYLLSDEPDSAHAWAWKSGLFDTGGHAKPAVYAFKQVERDNQSALWFATHPIVKIKHRIPRHKRH